ncbi:flagellar hook-length control protein FliK [Geobacillus sp. C56-T2]|uniref:flagellar hook-length control protein FliK n=1 Tax=Geobacillus sp. C56-T2 TaxID=600773 RepID=UPI0011AD0BB7|nr:flagellar hook-length control protein FliK [Geobacillus sp. C56-T2]TWG30079.1 flagellar hook-length control protein FliK [Geobacillus sp. C56-T2]
MNVTLTARSPQAMGDQSAPAPSKKETGPSGAFAQLLAHKQTEPLPVETAVAERPPLPENKAEQLENKAEQTNGQGGFEWLSLFTGPMIGIFPAFRCLQTGDDQMVVAREGQLISPQPDRKGQRSSIDIGALDLGREGRMAAYEVGRLVAIVEQASNHDSNRLSAERASYAWSYKANQGVAQQHAETTSIPLSSLSLVGEHEQQALDPVLPVDVSTTVSAHERLSLRREDGVRTDGQAGFSAHPTSWFSPPLGSDSQTSQAENGHSDFLVDQVARALRLGRWMRLPGGAAQLVIRLHPEHLGTVTVKMTHEGGKLTAKLLVANDAVKELLHAHLPQLTQLLDASQITVEKWTVWTDWEGSSLPPQSEKRQGGRQHDESRREQKRESSPSSPFALDGVEADG